MEPRKITPDALKRVLADLKTGNEKAIGTWLFKGYRVQVSRYKSSGTERSALLYRRRRDTGLCVRCGAKVMRKNPLTGAVYNNGIVPSSDQSAFARAVLADLPDPNMSGIANNYQSLPRASIYDDKGDARVDYYPTQKQAAFVSSNYRLEMEKKFFRI